MSSNTAKKAKRRSKKKQSKNRNKKGDRNLKMASLARGTQVREVGINRKLNLARKELSFLANYDPKLGNGVRLKGSDFVQTLTTGSTAPVAGSTLVDLLVAPGEFSNTRLAQFSALFERYRVRSWTFWYIPNVPSTVAGSMISYPDYDVADTVSPTFGLNEALAHMGSQMFNVYSETPVRFDRVDPYTDLFTDAEGTDIRLTYVGRLRYLAAAALTASTTYGNIYMEYDIDFYIPQLQSSIIEVAVPQTLYLKSSAAQGQTQVNAGNQIGAGVLDASPTGSSLYPLGIGNIFTALFTPDAAALATNLQGVPLTGGGITAASNLFLRVVSPEQSGVSGAMNNAAVAIYRSIVDCENDQPTASTSGGTQYAFNSTTSDLWKAIVNIPSGALMGALTNIRLIPYDRFASITY